MAAPVLEKTVKAAVQRVLKKRGADCYFVKATSDQASGTPDLLICYQGLFVGMELKRPGGKLSEIQEHRLSQIVRAGGIAAVVSDAEQAEKLLNRIDAYMATTPLGVVWIPE